MINGISDRGLWGSKTDFRSVGVYKMKGAEKDEYYRCTCEKSCKRRKMKAVVSITIDDEFVVHDIKVIEGEKGLFIAMPSRKAADGEYQILHILLIPQQETEYRL